MGLTRDECLTLQDALRYIEREFLETGFPRTMESGRDWYRLLEKVESYLEEKS